MSHKFRGAAGVGVLVWVIPSTYYYPLKSKWPFGLVRTKTSTNRLKSRSVTFKKRLARAISPIWKKDHLGRLALVILLDQFSRNLYRDSPLAYRFDPEVQGWIKEWLEAGLLESYSFLEKVFLYLPLEHSELLADQSRSVQLFTELKKTAPIEAQEAAQQYLDYANKHYQVVQRFGRFPHRNQNIRSSINCC